MTRSNRLARSEAAVEKVREISLFTGFDPTELDGLMDMTQEVSLAPGDQLFEVGRPANEVHYLVRGQLKLYRTSRAGEEKVVALVHPGDVFAEAILFMEGERRYPVSAAALDDSEVWSFDTDYVRAIIGASTDNCFRLLRRLSVRLHEMVDEIDRLTLHNATFRLVNFLLRELPIDAVSSGDIQLTASKVVIASRLSVKPETLSRVLHRLADQNLVKVEGAHIVLHDVDGLRRLLDE